MSYPDFLIAEEDGARPAVSSQQYDRRAVPRRTRADIEATVGVEPVEQLHARRRELWRENAKLYARVEMFEHRRKKLLSLKKLQILNSYEKGGTRENEKRPSNADLLDAMAHADEGYLNFLSAAEDDAARWALVEVQLKEVDELINRDQRLIGFATSELRV